MTHTIEGDVTITGNLAVHGDVTATNQTLNGDIDAVYGNYAGDVSSEGLTCLKGFTVARTYDPPALGAGQAAVFTTSVPGAEIGDGVVVGIRSMSNGLSVGQARIQGDGSVQIVFANVWNGTVDAAPIDLFLTVVKNAEVVP